MEANIKDVLFEQLRLLARESDKIVEGIDPVGDLCALTNAMRELALLLDESERADRARADRLAQQERENKFFNR